MSRSGPEWVPLDMGKHIGSIHKKHYAELQALLPGLRPEERRAASWTAWRRPWCPTRRCCSISTSISAGWCRTGCRSPSARMSMAMSTCGACPTRGARWRSLCRRRRAAANMPKRIADIEAHAWPDPEDPAQFAGLTERARALYENTGFVHRRRCDQGRAADERPADPRLRAVLHRHGDQPRVLRRADGQGHRPAVPDVDALHGRGRALCADRLCHRRSRHPDLAAAVAQALSQAGQAVSHPSCTSTSSPAPTCS